MYYPLLIWFWAKESGQERLMAVSPVRQITPDSACRGWSSTLLPCNSDVLKTVLRRWTIPSLNANSGPHSETIPGRLSQCGPRALCTTWSMHQAHLGETHTGMGVICLTQVHLVSQHITHAHTLESTLRASHMSECTCTYRYTSVNAMLFVHMSILEKCPLYNRFSYDQMLLSCLTFLFWGVLINFQIIFQKWLIEETLFLNALENITLGIRLT